MCKKPPGSAVFEVVLEQEHTGIVLSPVQHFSAAAATSGVIAFKEDERPAKILFGEHDFKVCSLDVETSKFHPSFSPLLFAQAAVIVMSHHSEAGQK